MHSSGADGPPAVPGFVTTIVVLPVNDEHTFFTTVILVNVSFVPDTRSLNLIFFGICPFNVNTAPALMFCPNTSSVNFPDTEFLFSSHLVSTARSDPGVPPPPLVVVLHVNVTCTPCSLPNGHPAGDPATAVVMFRLVPFGPLTKIRNVFPAFALPKLNRASISCAFKIWNATASIRVAGFARSNANTDVTFGTPLIMKHAPDINRSCGTAQLPSDGVTENTTGALVPRLIEHATVRVNGPKMLLSPDENVVVTNTVPAPPQHAAGNPLVEFGPNVADTGIVALTRLQLTGVTFVNVTTDSAIPSPFVSHDNVTAVVTVFPGLCNGSPVSASNP